MTDVVGFGSLLVGVILLVVSSIGLVARLSLRGVVANILAGAVIGYALIVVIAQILSEVGMIQRAGFLFGEVISAVLILPWTIKLAWRRVMMFLSTQPWQQVGLHTWLRQYPALTVLGFIVVLWLLLAAYLVLTVPPNTPDSLWYHLSRVAHWLHNGTLHHFATADLQKIAFSINAELGFLWLVALWGNDQLTGLAQWLITLLTMVTIYGLGRRLSFSRPASLFAALVWSTFTVVVAQTTSTKNDITVAFFVGVAFYFFLEGLRDKPQKYQANLLLFGLALGLALGTKTTAWLIIPGLGLLAGGLTLVDYRRYLPRFLYAALFALLGFGVVGAYNYVLNWGNYGSPFGPAELVEEHGPGLISPVTVWSNLGRNSYDFVNPGGLPEPVVEAVQQWRPVVGEIVFAWLHILPNPPEDNWTDSLFTFDDSRQVRVADDTAWYGPLGALLFLPVLGFYLFQFPFARQSLWRWLTALLVVSFFIALAIFIRWRPYTGRFLLIPIVIGVPLLAGFYEWSEKFKELRWGVVVVAATVLVWSGLHTFDRPILGPERIWDLDYYAQRVIRRQFLAPAYAHLDATLSPEARLGVAGEGFIIRWDYPFFGRDLTREVVHIVPTPQHIDQTLFTTHTLDYLLIAADNPAALTSEAPLWPILRSEKENWFLVKRTEIEAFSGQPESYQALFGADYQAYLTIKEALQAEPNVIRILTTDPKMPYYERDERFVFNLPENLGDLAGVTHLVLAPWWTAADYERLGLSLAETQQFLAQGQFAEEILAVNSYKVYRLLPRSGS